MSILQFDRMEVEDFKEIRAKQKISFSLLGLGVHFVSGVNEVEPRLGSNGAGKSTIWDALCWCLFGRTVSGLRGVDIRTWGAKTHPRVEIILYVDGKKHKIVRSTQANGLWLDDKVIEQAVIDRLLGLTFANFPHTILLGQGQPLFFDLPAPAKMEVLSETLDLDRWERYSAKARTAVKALDDQWLTLSGQAGELERTKAENARTIADLEGKQADWNDEAADRDQKRSRELKELGKKLDAALKRKGDHDLALDGAETEARASRADLEKKQRLLESASIRHAELNAELIVLLDEHTRLEKEAEEVGDTCQTCGQSLKGSALKQHQQNAKKRLRVVEKSGKEKAAEVERAAKIKQDALDLVEDIRADIAVFEGKADDARDGFTRAQGEVAEINARIKALNDEAGKEQETSNPYTDLLRKAKKQRSTIASAIEEAKTLGQVIEQKREDTAYWIQGFRNVRLYLLQEVLDELQGVTQTLLPQIGLEGWIVEFAMERETQAGKVKPGLITNIFKPGGSKPVRWESWSGGEGQRLRLIGAIALSEVLLRRAGVECDLMILDEPTRHLSPEGVRETVDFLFDRGRDYQIFYVDHQAIETAQFMSTVAVRRTDAGVSISSVGRS